MKAQLKQHYADEKQRATIEVFERLHHFEKYPYMKTDIYLPNGERRLLIKRIELMYKKYPKNIFTWSAERIQGRFIQKLEIEVAL